MSILTLQNSKDIDFAWSLLDIFEAETLTLALRLSVAIAYDLFNVIYYYYHVFL